MVQAKANRIKETYVRLPRYKHSATTLHKVKTKDFAQETTTLYLTQNLANKYIASKQKSGSRYALEFIIGFMLGKCSIVGPLVSVGVAVIGVLNADYYHQISKLSTKGKNVEIRLISNRYGKYRYVCQWNGKTVKKRSGTRKENVPMVGTVTTTESTTISWSSKR